MANPAGEKLLKRLQYRFMDPALFQQSLTHKSYVNEHPAELPHHNERMEFLGDAVLDFVIADIIMERYEALSEGELSKMRARLVSEPGLAAIARDLELGACLRMGRGEERSGGRSKNSILSDALEALLAAIYLDSRESVGIAAIFAVIARLFEDRIDDARSGGPVHDFKTELQEAVQRKFKDKVVYKVLSEKGPDHEKIFEVGVYFQDREYGRGSGRSKKNSEQMAAQVAMQALGFG